MNMRTLFCLVAIAVLAACAAHQPDAAKQRVVAIGDIHADINAARGAFQLAGAIDEQDKWIGGDLVVVQMGDVIGRSYEDREVLDFIFDLRDKADAAGGKVHVLIGNHEVFGAQLKILWVPDEAYAAFADIPDLDVDNPRLALFPEYKRARIAALMPGGHYAKQLAAFPAVLQLGETVFVHGGVTPHWARYGVNRINAEVGRWFSGRATEPVSTKGVDAGNDDDNVMMSRHFSEDVSEEDCAMLQESLMILGAKRMIVAHSVQESITARCAEQVWAIDIGMSRYYGGNLQVLEIIDDEILTVIGNGSEQLLR